ncbi:MAG TPA: alpha-amylase family glycosyl hydrolase [Longimicrobium sp.]
MRRIALPTLCAALLACAASAAAQPARPAAPLPDWRRGGVCYEVFVRSFYDSNGDGIGDLNGLTQKLDYINDGNPATQRDLGADCIWLMPVAESPSYHGYDVSNYYRVEPDYGTNDDFKRFMAEAHRRGIRVLVDMVLNHASSEHPYFQAALRDTTSPYRAWFRWSPQPQGNGPWGGPAWRKSPVRDEYFYGVFWEGMPDLNYATPAVRAEANRVADFWLREMGVDGFRLDAVPYLVEEGTVLAGSPGTHTLLHEYGDHVRAVNPRAWTVGEVWDSTGAMLKYYPDQLDSYFTFEISDAVLKAVDTGSAGGMLDGYMRLQGANLPGWRYSPFLRNHDQTRTMTVLKGDRAKARMATTLLLTLPGLPFVYYGEEIGMTGDKPDERLRTPMQWSAGPGVGFTRGTPWEAPQGDAATVNVASQENDPGSLLNLHRRLIHLRTSNPALAMGRLIPLVTANELVAAYLRREGNRAVLVVANLGNVTQTRPALASEAGALPAGRYALRNLLGGAAGAPLRVGADGRVTGYVPVATLGPREARVFELVRPTR